MSTIKTVEFIYYYEKNIIISVFYVGDSEYHRKIVTHIERITLERHIDFSELPLQINAEMLAETLKVEEKDSEYITEFELLLNDLVFKR